MCIDSWKTWTIPGCSRCQGWGRSCCCPCPRPSPPIPLESHLLLVSWCLRVNWPPLSLEDFELILLGPWRIDLIPCLLSLCGRLWITARELQLHSLHWTSCLLRGVCTTLNSANQNCAAAGSLLRFQVCTRVTIMWNKYSWYEISHMESKVPASPSNQTAWWEISCQADIGGGRGVQLALLGKEVREICEEIQLPDINKYNIEKTQIRDAIYEAHHKSMISLFETSKKLQDIKGDNFRGFQKYFHDKNLANARFKFKIRCKMVEKVPGNFKNKYKFNEIGTNCQS